jgi:hypothetical protein
MGVRGEGQIAQVAGMCFPLGNTDVRFCRLSCPQDLSKPQTLSPLSPSAAHTSPED